MRRLLGAVLLCLPLTAWAAPQRVVSLNLCTDQLLLMLLPRERIVMLSQLATDRSLSWMAAQAEGIERFDGSVESIVRLAPDLILSGTLASRARSRQIAWSNVRIMIPSTQRDRLRATSATDSRLPSEISAGAR